MSNLFKTRRNQRLSLEKLRNSKISGANTAGLNTIGTNSVMNCPACKNEYGKSFLKSKLYVCPDCGYHIPISAKRRILQVVDEGSFQEQRKEMRSGDPLDFPDYEKKLSAIQEKNGNKDAIMIGTATILGRKVELVVLDQTFMMGSMGTVVGEKFVLAVEYAERNHLPLVAFSASGGARMQEGMFSLMQMAKTSAAIKKFSEKGGFFLSVLTHPTMGGVSASFAMLGDIIIAEQGALVGFAGPRVIEQTIREKLPAGFQRAEFQQEHGFVDMVCKRSEMRENIGKILKLHQ